MFSIPKYTREGLMMSLSRMFLFLTAIVVVVFLLPAVSNADEAPKKPTLVELMSPGCPACAEMEKVLAQFEEQYGDTVEVQIVNVREYPDVARLYQVRYVPTLVFIDENGKMLEKRVGYMPLEALEKEWRERGYNIGKGE